MDYASWRDMQEQNPVADDFYLLAQTEDILGSKLIVSSLWKNQNRDCLVIYGPEGCGKHTMAAYFLDEIWNLDSPCQSLLLQGDSFDKDYSELSVLEGYLDSFIEDCYNGKGYNEDGELTRYSHPLDAVILIDRPDFYSRCDGLLQYLHGKLRSHRITEQESRLFLVVISTGLLVLPPAMSTRTTMVQVRHPNQVQRLSFVKKSSSLQDYIHPERIAELTEGMTYLQLRKALDSCVYICDEFTKEELEAYFLSQAPLLSPEEHRIQFEEKLPIALGELAKSFVNMIGSGVAIRGRAADPLNQGALHEKTAEKIDENTIHERGDSKRNELEKLPPYKLAGAILSQSAIDHINASGRVKIIQ